MLRLCNGARGGAELAGGETRPFLEDGDEGTLRGWCARHEITPKF